MRCLAVGGTCVVGGSYRYRPSKTDAAEVRPRPAREPAASARVWKFPRVRVFPCVCVCVRARACVRVSERVGE